MPQFISDNSPSAHSCAPLVKAMRDLIAMNWVMEVRHAFCEANACADGLAKHSHYSVAGLYVFRSMLPYIFSVFLADSMGHCSPRIISY